MAWGTIGTGVAVLALAALWYGLQVAALRDLYARPRVRGNNKLLWAFAILCVPYVGALGYLSMGPTSFLPRPRRVARRTRVAARGRVVRTTTRPAQRTVQSLVEPLVFQDDGPPRDARPRRSALRPAVTTLARAAMPHDPVIGTDSSDLLVERARPTPARRSSADAIRWPGAPIQPSYQQADADVRD